MKKVLMIVGAIGVIAVAYYLIAPEEKRDALLERVENLGRASDGEHVAKVVREQQRKERIRQNNTWTPENRALHPVEYCQAQLEDLLLGLLSIPEVDGEGFGVIQVLDILQKRIH